MKRVITVIILLANIVIFSACFYPCFCQQQVEIVQSLVIKGNIANIDLVNSEITVKYLQPNGNNDEITLGANVHTIITQGDLRISLSDLNEGDEVAVQYYDDPMSFDVLKASQINVKP